MTSKSKLNLYCQKSHAPTPCYTTERTDHGFVSAVTVKIVGSGVGMPATNECFKSREAQSTKKAAENDAATAAVDSVVQRHPGYTNIDEILDWLDSQGTTNSTKKRSGNRQQLAPKEAAAPPQPPQSLQSHISIQPPVGVSPSPGKVPACNSRPPLPPSQITVQGPPGPSSVSAHPQQQSSVQADPHTPDQWDRNRGKPYRAHKVDSATNVSESPTSPSSAATTVPKFKISKHQKMLEEYCKTHELPEPKYSIRQVTTDQYTAVVIIGDMQFRTDYHFDTFEKAKDNATLLAIADLGVRNLRIAETGQEQLTPSPVALQPHTQPAVSKSQPTPSPVALQPPTQPAVSKSQPTPSPVALQPPTQPAVSKSQPTPSPVALQPPTQPAVSKSQPFQSTIQQRVDTALQPPAYFQNAFQQTKSPAQTTHQPTAARVCGIPPTAPDLQMPCLEPAPDRQQTAVDTRPPLQTQQVTKTPQEHQPKVNLPPANSKQILNEFCTRKCVPLPRYEVEYPEDSVGYIVTMSVSGKKFSSPPLNSKKLAENAAAAEAVKALGILTQEKGAGTIATVQTFKSVAASTGAVTEESLATTNVIRAERFVSYKNHLQEHFQKARAVLPYYETSRSDEGFVSTVSVQQSSDGGQALRFTSRGHPVKKAAEQDAARMACTELGLIQH